MSTPIPRDKFRERTSWVADKTRNPTGYKEQDVSDDFSDEKRAFAIPMLPASISFQAGALGPGMVQLVPRSLIICKWEEM
jgi:hypothetical protein